MEFEREVVNNLKCRTEKDAQKRQFCDFASKICVIFGKENKCSKPNWDRCWTDSSAIGIKNSIEENTFAIVLRFKQLSKLKIRNTSKLYRQIYQSIKEMTIAKFKTIMTYIKMSI